MILEEFVVDPVSDPMFQAVLSKDTQLLQELLQNGHPTNITDNRGWTPLQVAAFEGCVEAVQHLLMADDIQGESSSKCGLSALYLACCGTTDGHRKVVELLLGAGADPDLGSRNLGFTPLHAAIRYNNLEIVKLLLGSGADPGCSSYLKALFLAAERGTLEIAQFLLEKGGNLHINLCTFDASALHCLCFNYKQDRAATYNSMLDLFLSYDSDINAQMDDGTTPLMLAVQRGWDRAVDRLLEQGADVHLLNHSNLQALHIAVEFTSDSPDRSSVKNGEELGPSIFEKILSRTSHNRIPQEGLSIFHLAIEQKRYKELHMLIEEGINPDEFVQEMRSSTFDQWDAVRFVTSIHTFNNTPLGCLLSQGLTQEVVDMAKYMIDKGSNINALKHGILPPLVAALKNHHPGAFEEGGLGQEILQYLLARGVDVMHKLSESDLLPAALAMSSLFNVVGFFRLLLHGVPAHRLYTHPTLTALMQHYQAEP